MNPDFQQAIEMTRAGDKVGAQKKVAAILKEDPNNAHAWYLLSLLVDSDEKRAVYLSKVIALDPNHEKAMEQLSMLEATSAPAKQKVASTDDEDVFDQAEASTVPDWMDDFDTAVTDTAVLEEEEPDEPEPIPDWVQEDLSHSWVDEENSIAAPAKSSPPAAKTTAKKAPPTKAKKKAPDKKKAAAAKKKKQAQQLNIILAVLVIVTILIAIALLAVLL